MKKCTQCLEEKEDEFFSIKRTNKNGSIARRAKCKDCISKLDSAYYIDNREKVLERCKEYGSKNQKPRDRTLQNLKRHGIDTEQFNALKDKFDGKCWSCKDRPAKHIDHDHNCCSATHSCGNCIRGILCHQCNIGLGMFSDSVQKMNLAISYLQTYSGNRVEKEI